MKEDLVLKSAASIFLTFFTSLEPLCKQETVSAKIISPFFPVNFNIFRLYFLSTILSL